MRDWENQIYPNAYKSASDNAIRFDMLKMWLNKSSIKQMCKEMFKNQFFSKITNTVRFTKKCSQEADIILVLLSILRPKWAL